MCNGKVKRQIRVDRMKVKSKRDVEQMREREREKKLKYESCMKDKKEERETETLKNGKTWKGGGEKQRENEKADKYQE